MTKKDLIRRVAHKSGCSQQDATRIVDALTATIEEAFVSGQRVSLPGFGTFDLALRKARTARNPATGKSMEIPAKAVPKFVPGKHLRNAASESRIA